jgi:hypothetical protein
MISRRTFVGSLSAAAGLASASPVLGQAPRPAGLPDGARVPSFEFVYECTATLSETLLFGKTLEGTRRIIPITGGTVAGPRVRGTLLSGGFDWNLQRSDGAGSVDATYYMRTDDDVFIRITNKGVGGGGTPPAQASGEAFFMFTSPSFDAPAGKYEWMNTSMFVGTLGARAGVRNAVVIRVFRLV